MECVRPHPLFTTAELLREIIKRIDKPATAAVCARVNRVWYQEATILLWRGTTDQSSPWRTPDVAFLHQLSKSPESFVYYVSLIKHLVLLHGDAVYTTDHEPDSLFVIENWSSCTAQTVLVDLGSFQMKEHSMRALLNPSLRALSLYGGYYSDSFFRTLRVSVCLATIVVNH